MILLYININNNNQNNNTNNTNTHTVTIPTDAVCCPDINIEDVALSNMIGEIAVYAVFSGLGFNVSGFGFWGLGFKVLGF